jgi:hypothetical protein
LDSADGTVQGLVLAACGLDSKASLAFFSSSTGSAPAQIFKSLCAYYGGTPKYLQGLCQPVVRRSRRACLQLHPISAQVCAACDRHENLAFQSHIGMLQDGLLESGYQISSYRTPRPLFVSRLLLVSCSTSSCASLFFFCLR